MFSKIKNIEQASARIKFAVRDKEKIILYGDSDVDGIVSVVLLREAIRNLGGDIFIAMFPDRENDGYGINAKAVEFLKDKPPALLITLDLGIANVKEVERLNHLGFEVIIIDHHQVLEKIPQARIIVNPQQKDDSYPFKELCNAGITFKLCQELISPMSQTVKNNLLELVALATISDMVPQIGENKIFIEEGLRSLKNTFRPGPKAFLEIIGRGEAAESNYGKLISALNAAESINFQNSSYNLLVSSSDKECLAIAGELISKARLKQQKIKEIAQEVERRIAKNSGQEIVFEGDPAWKLMMAGPVASIIAAEYEKPVFIFKKGEEESCGSVRSLKEGQNSVQAMNHCSDLLKTYGGHPKASGFRIKTENLEKFKNCLRDYFKKQRIYL